MTTGISPVGSKALAAQAAVAADPRAQKLRAAATEFESILVKQLLKAAKLGGSGDDEKTSGYGDMAVDAMASAVEHGGGLGLAKQIELAIGHGRPLPDSHVPSLAPSVQPPVQASDPHAAPLKPGG